MFRINSFNRKENATETAAQNEERITKEQLLLKMETLIKANFVGEFVSDSEKIEMKFMNGQKFIVNIGEVI